MKIELSVIAIDYARCDDKVIEFDFDTRTTINTVDIEIDGKLYTVDKEEFTRMAKAFSK